MNYSGFSYALHRGARWYFRKIRLVTKEVYARSSSRYLRESYMRCSNYTREKLSKQMLFICKRDFIRSKNGDLIADDYPKIIEEGLYVVVRKSIRTSMGCP